MKKINIFIIIFLLIVCLPLIGFSLSEREEIVIYQGQMESVSVSVPERIVIDKPEVVDVIRVGNNEMLLSGKQKGEAKISWKDNLGEHNLDVKVLAEDVEKIKKRIDDILKKIGSSNIKTKTMENEEKVFLLGDVKDEVDIERIFLALGDLKDKTVNLVQIKPEDAMVEISVQILEFQKGKGRNLGFELPSSITFSEINSSLGTSGLPFGGLFPIRSWDRDKFSGTLRLLINEGKAKVLSRPRLACRSGKEAELLVGGEIPIMTTEASGSSETPGTNIEYKEYGIKLKISPQVVDGDKIDILLSVEVTEVDEAGLQQLGGSDNITASAYPFTKRNVTTELSLRNNEILAIGGLIKQKTQEDLKKFPWLADIPILGAFFRSKNVTQGGGADEKGDTELFITLSPKIIYRDGQDNQKKIKESFREETLEKKISRYHDRSHIPDELQSYVLAVKKMILRDISYPEVASSSGWEGSLLISLKISSDGKLKQAKIAESSGNKIFDQDALNVAKAVKYPPFYYYKISLEEINLEIPIVYKPTK